MKPQSRKSKGRDFQKALVKLIYDTNPELEPGDVEWCSMGASGIDIRLSPKAKTIFPVSVEAKNTKDKPGPGALRQSKANAYPDTIPIVAWKPPRNNIYDGLVIVGVQDFLDLVRKANVSDKE